MMDIDKLREDTPACREVIHFNNAGAALMPDPVYYAVTRYLELERTIGGYEAMEQEAAMLDGFYESAAKLINAHPEEIAFVENATAAWNMAFYSFPFEKGDVVLASRDEYLSNRLAIMQLAKRKGIEMQWIPENTDGTANPEALNELITEKVKMIALTHMPTNNGLVNPAEAIGAIAAKHQIPYLLDACQSVGQYPVDVKKIKCDFLSTTGRKFLRGPRGTGFLYVKRERLLNMEPVMIDMHSAYLKDHDHYALHDSGKRFETWESSYAGKAGLKAAIDYANHLGIHPIWDRVSGLAQKLRAALEAVPGIRVNDKGTLRSGIVTFESKNLPAAQLKEKLFKAKMNVSIAQANPLMLESSPGHHPEWIRASVHYYNTKEEIRKFVEFVGGSVG